MNNDTTILIIGSTGFIGSAITKRLRHLGYNILTTTRDKSYVNNKNIFFLDLSKPETIINLTVNCDVIIHFGAKIAWSHKYGKEMLSSNTIATGLISSLASNLKARLIFASTVTVNGINTTKISSESLIITDTLYGKSKWIAEELIRMSGVEYCILRIGGVFGLNGPDHLGINKSIYNAISKKPPTLYGDGRGMRNYIYLWDVVEAVVYIIKNNINGVHLLSGTHKTTVNAMLNDICKVFDLDKILYKNSGEKIEDQLVEPSQFLPNTRSFVSALKDIRALAGEN